MPCHPVTAGDSKRAYRLPAPRGLWLGMIPGAALALPMWLLILRACRVI